MALLVPSPEISRVFSYPNPIPTKFKGSKILTTSKRFVSRITVCAKVREFEVRVSERNQNVSLYGQFSAPVKQGSKPSKEEEEKQKYYVNMGYAIRTIREEFPELFYRELSFDIYSVWQPMENVIMVRWTVHGIPRVPWESRGRFDGTSAYKLDKEGKIFEHRVHNIALNSPPKFKVLGVQDIIQSLGCPSTPKPTFFENSSSSSSEST
ncbi:uncharacterized protein LOC115705882 isoform X2 [Cannabis sativa]|uniref:uncharacterized protein LOC115705882 isoform X2 n=1 Tax=Cannabis sativa TaxID=3483 RepID=UPI0029CA91CE|nr:uncharacterized protein LOC115705882 isoform X2 [Cannabis sativa]